MSEVKVKAVVKTGALAESLGRNGTKIRADRARQIADDSKVEFRRTVEDIGRDIRRLEISKEGLLDMNGDNELSIISSRDFNVDTFIKETVSIVKQIANKQIAYDLLAKEYEYLFGEALNLAV
jgi:hypothetical protein